MGNNLFDEQEDGVLRVGADDADVISKYRGKMVTFLELRRISRSNLKTSIAIANASLESIRRDSLKKYGRGRNG